MRDKLSRNKPIEKSFMALSQKGLDIGRCFQDRLEIIVLTFVSVTNRKKEDIDELQKYHEKYGENFIHLSQAFDDLVNIMTDTGKDILGEFYQRFITGGENGQYFTPEHICDFMAEVCGTSGDVIDPCCGSGRMLLGAMKIDRNRNFVGADLDRRCALMTVINLFLNGIKGEVYHMDSLSMKKYDGWRFGIVCGFPYISKIDLSQTDIETKVETAKEEIKEKIEEKREVLEKKGIKVEQLSLF